jgi:hypothetical protein
VTIKAIATAAVALLWAGAAQADILHYEAVLKGAHETPANASHARGELTASVDSDQRTLDCSVTYSGLSGPATKAGFEDGGAATALMASKGVLGHGNQIDDHVQLTGPQMHDLAAGRWTFNISTMASPGGEISGKVNRSSGPY